MIDSQMPWLSVGASSTDLDSSSSLSLLHSIYGSQASQLPFSESDTSITGTRSEAPLIPALAADWRQRPKSSPAATLASRARERHQLRPGGTADRSTALRSRRPASSAPRRPPSAVPGRKEGRARPKTALGMVRKSAVPAIVIILLTQICSPPPAHLFVSLLGGRSCNSDQGYCTSKQALTTYMCSTI